MKETKNRAARDIIVVGFALFSMFFGAGNVIFPPYLGMESGPQWLAGFSAYFIADIGLALAAMFALLRVGSSEAVLQRVGCVPSEILMCAIILCVGPMVAIPRTSASTFEMAIAPNLPSVSAVVFSVLFFALILALCIRESAVVDIVGKVLTPLLLAGLAAIIIKGIVTPLGTIAPEAQIDSAVVTGVKAGYQTMDALAALPFGILVLQSVVDKGYTESGKKFRIMSGSSILACVLLLAVYMGLAYLGATVSAQYTSEIGRAQLVMAIVEALMGKTGMIIFGIVVGLACVTTAVALTSSAAAYFAKLCRGKVPYKVFVIVICVFSAVVSNLGLDRIVAIAAPVLDVVYPPTLVLIFISLVVPRLPDRISRGAVIGALWCVCGLLPLPDMLKAAGFCLIPVAATGGIHLDGLCDTCDALCSFGDREKRLAILKDPHVGAFGPLWLMAFLLAEVGCFAQIYDRPVLLPLACTGFAFARAMGGRKVVASPCAKDSGLAHIFAKNSDKRAVSRMLVAEFVLFAVLLGLWIYRVPHALAAAKVLVIVLVAWYAVHEHISRRVFGGVTGDLAGFCISLSELITLAAAAIGGLIL